MKVLIAAYILIACTFAYEGNWPKVGYWVSAAGITLSVLCMGGK